ncbi:SDR family NAD(P)-dependent oxidoreductase [Pseudonocardia sp. ICBG601]|uniref:SDR family NAD(P)-dependent oxidoreductase n=1 Tax=Pseudonocardia sp. ICBG601 TaxID=2846759 RepID=UPI001CF63478|nr:SDR family NAD(P)-dependent oxidoreductase [Pseudonocardia sp. ICBG601]
MAVAVVVGAGPGLGLSIARRFGAAGYDIALIGRTRSTLDAGAEELARTGVTAGCFVADVTDRRALIDAFEAIRAQFGDIDVLGYSPFPRDTTEATVTGATEVTVESLQPYLELFLFGGVTSVRQVLPGMIGRGRGTIIVTTGASSGPVVHPPLGNIAAASGALRNWVLNLHEELRDTGVYVAHVALATWIGRAGPASMPDTIARTYLDLHRERRVAEVVYGEHGVGSPPPAAPVR